MRIHDTTLGETCDFFNGKAHEKEIDEDGEFIVVNSKFISSDGNVCKYTAEQMFPLYTNDIVMVMSDVPNGKSLAKCYIIEENNLYSLNQRICAIRTNSFDIKFLYYQLNRHPYLLSFNNGENQTNLRKEDILNTPLWNPPFYEQQHIVSVLDEAFTAIDQAKANIERNITNAKELFQSKLNAIFSRKGEGTEKWEEKLLSEVCQIQPQKKEASQTLSDDSLVSFVPMPNLGIDEMYFSSEESRALSEVKGSYTYFRDGDVVLAKITPCFENGKLGIAKDLVNGVGFGSSEYIVYRTKENITAEYLYFFLNRQSFRQTGEKVMTGSVGHKRIPKEFYERTIISLPPLERQQQITIDLISIQSETKGLENAYQQKLIYLDELKKSLLQKAFSGELNLEKFRGEDGVKAIQQ